MNERCESCLEHLLDRCSGEEDVDDGVEEMVDLLNCWQSAEDV